MRLRARRLRRLAALLGVWLVAVACSDDDGTAAHEEAEPTETAAGGQRAAAPPAPPTGPANPSCEGESDGVLRLGGLLPSTGDLTLLGPALVAAAELALQDINDAGGVLDTPVEWMPGDSGDASTDTASRTVRRHLDAGADVIVGAASSDVTAAVIDTITGACRVQFSPTNTSADLTDYEDGELYFRTAPSDVLQGRVLAELAAEEGVGTLALLALRGRYGEGLLRFTKEPFEDAGGKVVVERVYDPRAANFDAEVDEVVSADPDGLVLIGFDESSRILTSLFEAGFTPVEKRIYLSAGNIGDALGGEVAEPGALAGIRGTLASAELGQAFQARLLAVDPELTGFGYAPETYDAVVITALAAELAGTDNPPDVARAINGVTRDGDLCITFAACKQLIAGGETDIDYDGPSGRQSFSQPGEPTEATFLIMAYGEDNRIDPSQDEYRVASF